MSWRFAQRAKVTGGLHESDSEMPLPQTIHKHPCEERILGANHPFDEPLPGTRREMLPFARGWRYFESILPNMEHPADLILRPVWFARVKNEAPLLGQLFIFTNCPKVLRLRWFRQSQERSSQTVVNPDLLRRHGLLIFWRINADNRSIVVSEFLLLRSSCVL